MCTRVAAIGSRNGTSSFSEVRRWESNVNITVTERRRRPKIGLNDLAARRAFRRSATMEFRHIAGWR